MTSGRQVVDVIRARHGPHEDAKDNCSKRDSQRHHAHRSDHREQGFGNRSSYLDGQHRRQQQGNGQHCGHSLGACVTNGRRREGGPQRADFCDRFARMVNTM